MAVEEDTPPTEVVVEEDPPLEVVVEEHLPPEVVVEEDPPPPQGKDQTRPVEKYCWASGWYALEKSLPCFFFFLSTN